jgi:hypothetical protein
MGSKVHGAAIYWFSELPISVYAYSLSFSRSFQGSDRARLGVITSFARAELGFCRWSSRAQGKFHSDLIAHVIDTRAFRGIVTVEFALRPGAPSAEPELCTCERRDDAETRPIGENESEYAYTDIGSSENQ